MDKTKFESLIEEFEKILQSKNYGMSDESYYQPLKKNEEYLFFTVAAAYTDLADVSLNLNFYW